MKLLPRDGYRFSCLKVFLSARDFLVPSFLDRFISGFKTVEQSVSQRSALI